MKDNINLEQRVEKIEGRNKKVEADKAWETSGFRKVTIFVLTYLIAAVWLIMIESADAWRTALVPAVGWYLSTLSIPFIKKWWTKKYGK